MCVCVRVFVCVRVLTIGWGYQGGWGRGGGKTTNTSAPASTEEQDKVQHIDQSAEGLFVPGGLFVVVDRRS